MIDEKGRDIGEPTVNIIRRHGTPEEVAYYRENFRLALSRFYSSIYGRPVKITLDWTEFDEHAKDLEYIN